MFQVAHGLSLVRRRGSEEVRFVDFASRTGRVPRDFGIECFGIKKARLSRLEIELMRCRIFASKRLQLLSPHLHLGVLLENIETRSDDLESICGICSGYWQGKKYFEHEAELVRSTFTFPAVRLPNDVISRPIDTNSVAVHVRRGDYVSDPVARAHHFVCDADWYLRAMEEVRSRLPKPIFYVFSDDKKWATELFGHLSDVTIVVTDPFASAWVDMAFMSRFSHFVISNSSYSWWAAYLGKTVNSLIIAPEYWFPNVLTVELEIMCEEWILV